MLHALIYGAERVKELSARRENKGTISLVVVNIMYKVLVIEVIKSRFI